MRYPKLIDKLYAALPPAGDELMRSLMPLAREQHLPLYLVGGSVRDLLLGRPCLDLDIAVEGDGIGLARRLGDVTGARLRVHPAFLTASLHLDGFVLDIATARTETYAHSGALPEVHPASIREDLLRRDFAINAMALRLNGSRAGELLDSAGGQYDLAGAFIRVLHERSFQDDATRIVRAVRYSIRLGFRIESETHEWLRRDIEYLHPISGSRIRQELSRILTESRATYMIRQLSGRRVLSTIHPLLNFHPNKEKAMDTLRSWGAPTAIFWPLLIWPDSAFAAASVSSRLALTGSQRAVVAAIPELRRLAPKLSITKVRRSRLVSLFGPFPAAAVWTVAGMSDGAVRERLLELLREARHVKPALRGDDLIALGVPMGPRVGEMLRRLRNAKLDGEVKSRADEERFVQRTLARSSSSVHLSSSSP